jgi:type IV fimbrial biogenesis protein FimT
MGTHTREGQRGATLIEGLMVALIGSVTLGTVAPGMTQLQDRRRLEAASAQLETELHYARSLAVARNESVRFSFQAQADSSCYVIHTGSANACQCATGAPVCTGTAQALRMVQYEAGSQVRSTSNSSSLLFDAAKGTVTPTATMELRNPRGDVVHLVINIMGRVRACTTTALPGYKAC